MQLSRGFGLFLASFPLALLANCGGGPDNGQERAAYEAVLHPPGSEVIRTGVIDRGVTENNCSQADAFQLDVHHDFEETFLDNCPTSPTTGQMVHAAPTWFSFSDSTTGFFRPGRLETRAPESTPPNTGWGIDAYPAASLPGGAACGSNGMLRIWGGPFAGWGGGVGSGYFKGATGTPQTQLGQFDASAYEGVSFWARRGPEGQTTLRVNVLDAEISEEFAKTFLAKSPPEAPPFCQVAIKCGCLNGKPCSLNEADQTYYCFDPAVDPAPGEPQPDPLGCYVQTGPNGDLEPQLRDPASLPRIAPAKCGDSLCADRVLNVGQFEGSTCELDIFDNSLTGEFCVQPGKEIPQPTDRCGNAWSAIVNVGTEWKLYTVPFSELQQADYAYKGTRLDPTQIWGLGFGFGGGWVDVYIDDVGFYKKL
jgi:hypothetical protein